MALNDNHEAMSGAFQSDTYGISEQHDKEPVTVSIVVNDPHCAKVIDRVSVNVLYCCVQCGYTCRILPLLAEHIGTCVTVRCPDIDAKLTKLLELLNEENKIQVKEYRRLAKELALGDTQELPRSENTNTDLSRAETVNTSEQLHLRIDESNRNEPNGTVYIMETRKSVLGNEQRSDSQDPESDLEFHDDEMIDPDYVSQSRNTTDSVAKDRAKRRKNGKGTSPNMHADIEGFLTKYEQFVVESVHNLFKQNSPSCGIKDTVESGRKDCSPVLEPCADFDFTQDVKSILRVPILDCKSDASTKWHCTDCPDVDLLSERDLEYHMRCHSGDGDHFRCCTCVRRSATRRNHVTQWPTMRAHLASVHSVDFELPCHHCALVFTSLQKLESHVKKVHALSCTRVGSGCKFVAFDAAEMRLHEMCHGSDNSKLFRCPECHFMAKKGDKYQDVRRHIEELHQNLLEQKYSCQGCADGFSSEESYKSHYFSCCQVKHLYHRCMFCMKASPIPVAALADHLGTHRKSAALRAKIHRAVEMLAAGQTMSEIYSTLCTVADSSHSGLELVQVNGNGAGKQVSFKCKFCYKKLKNEVSFERHMMKSHPEGNDNAVCQLCGKLFRTKNQYRNHYQIVHQGIKRKYVYRKRKENPRQKEKPLLKCEHCDYTSPYQTRVRNHTMSVHMGVFPYKCASCGYGTNEVSDLRRHENKHAGIKRHACVHCDYRAAYYWLLVTHCKRQHNVEIPKKRKPFNFMGSDGSLRWKRRREKERDLQQRRSGNNSNARKFHENLNTPAGDGRKSQKMTLLSNGQHHIQLQTVKKIDGVVRMRGKAQPPVQTAGERSDVPAMGTPVDAPHVKQGEILYINEKVLPTNMDQVKTFYLVVE